MKKHAYLIMAHSNFQQLSFLLSLVDDKRNDIFIHIDAKSRINDKTIKKIQNSCQYSDIFFTERIPIYWGGFSQIEAEMILFKESRQKNQYEYYHLLSGVDLPLVSQEVIHSFFNQHESTIFISRMTLEGDRENVDRIKYYHFFEHLTPRTFPGIFGKGLFKIYRRLEVTVQKMVGIDLLKKFEIKPQKSSNWVSLPNNIVEELLKNKDWINMVFKKSFLSDEVFIPVFLLKFGFNHLVYDNHVNVNRQDEFQGNLRFVNWWDGNPYTWTASERDKKILIRARERGHFFARKFDIEAFPETKEFIKELTSYGDN